MSTATEPSREIRLATPHDCGRIANLLTRAFSDDPIFGWAVPRGDHRAAILGAMVGLVARSILPHGSSAMMTDGSGAILWVPAGQAAVPEEEVATFQAAMAQLFRPHGERMFAVLSALEEYRPTAEHRYLAFI